MERRSRVYRISLDSLFLRSGLTIYSAGASQSERHADFMKLAVHFSGGLSSKQPQCLDSQQLYTPNARLDVYFRSGSLYRRKKLWNRPFPRNESIPAGSPRRVFWVSSQVV